MSDMILAVTALIVALGLSVRFTVFSGNRNRPMRWRIRLHLHPGQGFASFAELWCRWSRQAAIGHGRRARPGLRLRHRLRAPHDRLRGPPRPRPVAPPGVRPDRGPGAHHGRAADREVGCHRRPDPRPPRPGAGDQHPGRPVRADRGPAGPPRPGPRVQPAGRRRRPLHAGVGPPGPVPGPGDGPPDGHLAQGPRHRRGPAVVPGQRRRRAAGPAVGRGRVGPHDPGRVPVGAAARPPGVPGDPGDPPGQHTGRCSRWPSGCSRRTGPRAASATRST